MRIGKWVVSITVVCIQYLVAESPDLWKEDSRMWGFSFLFPGGRPTDDPMVIREIEAGRAVGDRGAIAVLQFDRGDIHLVRESSPTEANLTASARHPDFINISVAVGEQGSILFRTNDTSWQLTTLRESVRFEDVIYVAGQWVAVGWDVSPENEEITEEGWIVTSTDGITWSISSFAGFRFYSIEHQSGRWIIGGASFDSPDQQVPALLESPDSKNWTSLNMETNHFPQDALFRHVVHGDRHWLGVIQHQPNDAEKQSLIVRSENGFTWTVSKAFTGFISKPAYSNLRWRVLFKRESVDSRDIPFTYVYDSGDGMDWTILECLHPKTLVGHSITSNGSSGFHIAGTSTGDLHAELKPNILFEDLPVLPGIVHDVEESEGQWIAVGSNGVLQSSNGVDWVNNSTPFGSTIYRVMKRGNRWMVLGNDGGIWTSINGTTWQKVYEQPDLALRDMDYSSGRWVVVGSQESGGVILTSTDIENWDFIETESPLDQIEVGNGTWLALGGAPRLFGDSPYYFGAGPHYLSGDGIEWKTVPRPKSMSGEPLDLTYGNGLWLEAVGGHNGQGWEVELHGSYDARNWETFIAWLGGGPTWYESDQWWLGALNMDTSWGTTSAFRKSTDGRSWESLRFDAQIPKARIRDVIVRDDAIHLFHADNAPTTHKLIHSASEPEPNIRQEDPIHKVRYGDHQWLGIGESNTATSVDGINWFSHSLFDGDTLGHIAYGDRVWGIISAKRIAFQPAFFTSDGLRPPIKRFQLEERLGSIKELTFQNGLWWILTTKMLVTSDDSYEPLTKFSGADVLGEEEELKAIAFSSNTAIALTDKGTTIQSSAETQYSQWSVHLSSDRAGDAINISDLIYQDIGFGAGLWQAVSIRMIDGGYRVWMEQSTDGQSWTGKDVTSLPVNSDAQFKLKYGNGTWVLCGGGGKTEHSLVGVYTSGDGQNWQLVHVLENASTPESLECGGHQWIITLLDGTILRSGPDNWLSAELSETGNQPKLTVKGMGEQNLRIEISTDLETWAPWKDVKTFADPMNVAIPTDLNAEGHYFRAIPVQAQ